MNYGNKNRLGCSTKRRQKLTFLPWSEKKCALVLLTIFSNCLSGELPRAGPDLASAIDDGRFLGKS